jgi:hypothetical protein
MPLCGKLGQSALCASKADLAARETPPPFCSIIDRTSARTRLERGHQRTEALGRASALPPCVRRSQSGRRELMHNEPTASLLAVAKISFARCTLTAVRGKQKRSHYFDAAGASV